MYVHYTGGDSIVRARELFETQGENSMKHWAIFLVLAASVRGWCFAEDIVKIGFNYPITGPYTAQGKDQKQAADLAVEEINAAGGILGKKIVLIERDSQSKPDVTMANVRELINKEGVQMVFGGSASSVAIAAGKVCQISGVPFFGTLTYSTETTCEDAHRFVFRECYDSWAAAKVLANYINQNFAGKKFFYITADYTWGNTTEAAFRKFTHTEDTTVNGRLKTPFPTATADTFNKAIAFAKLMKPDVLMLVLFGKDMELAVKEATAQGLKDSMQLIVPNLTLGMAEGAGPQNMAGVLGALPWAWNVPAKFGFAKGIEFVDKFAAKYNRYPCTSGSSAYTILYEYKAAAERAGGLEPAKIVKALEGHKYTLLKDEQSWRPFDHQSIQTVYAVRCKPAAEVEKDKFKLDFFEILSSLSGEQAFRTQEEWNGFREIAGKPTELEKLPGE
jgi:branched-chain amino acid transport system substrate-binding protein